MKHTKLAEEWLQTQPDRKFTHAIAYEAVLAFARHIDSQKGGECGYKGTDRAGNEYVCGMPKPCEEHELIEPPKPKPRFEVEELKAPKELVSTEMALKIIQTKLNEIIHHLKNRL